MDKHVLLTPSQADGIDTVELKDLTVSHSVRFVLIRAADVSVKSAQAPTSVQAGPWDPYQDNLEGIRPSGPHPPRPASFAIERLTSEFCTP